MRPSGRALNEMRSVSIETGFTKHAEGSVLIETGDTKVICTATIEAKVPPFLRNKKEVDHSLMTGGKHPSWARLIITRDPAPIHHFDQLKQPSSGALRI